MAQDTYTVTIGGEDYPKLTAKEADRLAVRTHNTGQPYMVHTDNGRCVCCGNGHVARVDQEAFAEYSRQTWDE
jgi:hypothetical protein